MNLLYSWSMFFNGLNDINSFNGNNFSTWNHQRERKLRESTKRCKRITSEYSNDNENITSLHFVSNRNFLNKVGLQPNYCFGCIVVLVFIMVWKWRHLLVYQVKVENVNDIVAMYHCYIILNLKNYGEVTTHIVFLFQHRRDKSSATFSKSFVK